MVKNPPANAGDLGSSLCREDPPEKEMATHSNILPIFWEIQWTEEPGGLQSLGSQESDTVTKQQGRGYVLCFRDKKLRFYKPLSNLFTHPLGSG